MRAAVLEAPGQVVLKLIAPPAGEDLVQVRVEQVGVCGTDLSVVSGALHVRTPLVLGHEVIGRVATPAEGLPAGTRVLVNPSSWCGRCRTCLRGLEHLCPQGGLMGRDIDGGMAEAVAVPATRLHPLPEELDRDVAAILQVLGTCVHAQRQAELFPGQVAAVVGLGVSGLLHVQLLRARGAACVLGVSRSASKRALALTLGATATALPSRAVRTLREQGGGHGADLVVEAAGAAETVALSVDLASPGGTVVVFGTAAGGASAPYFQMYHKELLLRFPRAARACDYEDAISLAKAGAVRASGIVTDRLSLEAVPSVLSTWPEDPSRLKVVFEP